MVAARYGTELEPAQGLPRRGWSVGARLLLAAAAVVLVLGATAVAMIVADPHRLGMAFSGAPDGSRSDTSRPDGSRSDADAADHGKPGGTGAAAAEQTVTAPVAGRRQAAFVLADGVSLFELRVDDLGDDLYRISSPADSGVAPRPEVLGERVQLRLARTAGSGPTAVRVLLNARVDWSLRLVGGVSSQVLDLTGARLRGVELVGGSARTELLLPPVRGTVTVRMTGGVNQLDIRVPDEAPVRVRVAAGAGSVALREDRRVGVAAGALLSTPGWDRSVDRLFVDLAAGANTVTVTAAL